MLSDIILKPIVNYFLGDLGTINCLHIDSKSKEINVKIDLEGEKLPIDIQVLNYEILKEKDQHYLLIKEINFSREWMNIAMRRWNPEMKFPVSGVTKVFL